MSIFNYVLFVNVVIKLDVTCSSEISSRSEHDNDIFSTCRREKIVRKVKEQDLVEMPKCERLKTPQWKLFTSHLLMNPENQKIREADEVARQKEKRVIEKQQLIKNLIAKDRRGRGRGRGGPPKL